MKLQFSPCVHLLGHQGFRNRFLIIYSSGYSSYLFCIFYVEIQADIQALVHAVELTRQGAVDSLRFAKGELFLAFQVC